MSYRWRGKERTPGWYTVGAACTARNICWKNNLCYKINVEFSKQICLTRFSFDDKCQHCNNVCKYFCQCCTGPQQSLDDKYRHCKIMSANIFVSAVRGINIGWMTCACLAELCLQIFLLHMPKCQLCKNACKYFCQCHMGLDLAWMTSAGLAVMSANIFMETFRQIITAIGISASIPFF